MKWLVALALVLASAAHSEEARVFDVPQNVGKAAREGKRLMVYLYQEACPYCRRLVEVNLRDPHVARKVSRHFIAVGIDIWGKHGVAWYGTHKMSEQDFARMLNVQFTPTVLVFNEKGGVALRLDGYLPPQNFADALDEATLERGAKPHPGRKKVINLRRKGAVKPMAVLVVAPECAACTEIEGHFERAEVRRELEGLELVRVPNGTYARTNAGEALLESRYVPALVFFDARGREVFRADAYLRPFHLASSIEYVTSGAYVYEPFFPRFVEARLARLKARGDPVDLWD